MSVVDANSMRQLPVVDARRRHGDPLRDFLAAGLDLAGPGGEEALAQLMGEADRPFPGGAAERAVLGTLLRTVDDFSHRTLSDRERARTAAVTLATVRRLTENLAAGLGVRRDDFFVATPSSRSAADEAAEGVLLAAQRESEEAKLPYLGNLLAGIACREDLQRAEIAALVRLASNLSYRQFGLLAVFAHTERFELRAADYHGQGRVSFAAVAVLHETLELVRTSVVVQTIGEPVVLRDLTPSRLAVAGMGALLVKLMGLGQFDPAECAALAALLR